METIILSQVEAVMWPAFSKSYENLVFDKSRGYELTQSPEGVELRYWGLFGDNELEMLSMIFQYLLTKGFNVTFCEEMFDEETTGLYLLITKN